ALTGGLPAAAGVYVISKIFEKQVDKFSSAVYRISGTWQEPVLKFDRLFDTKPRAQKPKSDDSSADSEVKLAPENAAETDSETDGVSEAEGERDVSERLDAEPRPER
ncbi:MAG: hypothetical protein RI942_324, partial [Pseudomonadota bacterium]